MEILTVRPKGMPNWKWEEYNKKLKAHIRRRKSRPVWFASGVKEPTIMAGGKRRTGRYIINPMGTYRRGMKTL